MEICVEYLGLTPVDRVAGLLSFSTISGLTTWTGPYFASVIDLNVSVS